ncbi:hypothetical protein ACROYT_G006421 [Oculina patagonica]
MPSYNLYTVCFVLNFIWIFNGFESTAVLIRVSKLTGHDNSSCLLSDATRPCKTLIFALNATNDTRNRNETNFSFSIEDRVYYLEKRIKIIQTSPDKSIYLKSSHSAASIIHCVDISAGIEIGSRANHFNKTRNINFANLEFENCGPRFAAVVIVWNSVDINFTNCVFKYNKQAGINSFESGVTIKSCLFLNNTSNRNNSSEEFKEGETTAGGGAGFIFRNAVALSVIISSSNFTLNSAVTNDSTDFISTSSNVSNFISGGGGLLVVFLKKTNHCRVVIDDTVFSNNSATFGGGVYFANSNMALRNNYSIANSRFLRNMAGQTGGGLIFSQWDKASSITTIFKNCTVSENQSRRGAGMNVFLMNYDETPNDSVLRFDTVLFSNNFGDASTAIRFTTALPYGSTMDVTPEFIDCTIEDHNMSSFAHTSPFTSQRVNIIFKGQNTFRRNLGGGAAGFQDCVLKVHGQLVFANNTGSNGGAMFLRSSQIILHPDSELMFLGNKAWGLGGAIFVWEHTMNEFIHVNNPDCFLAYSDPSLSPSKWKTNISFTENSSTFKGAAIYVSSLQRCVWTEEFPYHNPRKALRWSSNFVYKNNWLMFDGGTQTLCGPKYDIATDTKSFHSTKNNSAKLSPGQNYPLNLQGVDELGHNVLTIAFVSEADNVNSSSKLLLQNDLYVLSPNETSTVPFSFRVPQTLYNETHNRKDKRKIRFVDFMSTLANGYSFELELQMCRPGFHYSIDSQTCECNKELAGIMRCDNGEKIYLKQGYWANITKDGAFTALVTYFCPHKYCNCKEDGDLPGCLFDPDNSNGQCSKNREGWLCGKCAENTSVGLRGYDCIDCPDPGWVLAVVIPVVIALCILIIWLNPGISCELRGPLFFFQVLPYIFDPTSHLGGHVFLLADLFNFGGPLIYLSKTCIIKGINNLYLIAFGYILPGLALFIFLLAYLLSANYCLRFNLRRRSMLQSFWLLVVFMYNYLVETSFLILFCPKVGHKDVFFYDGTMECFHGDHLPIAIVAILVLVFLVIPPPIIVFVLTNGYWRVDPQYLNTLTSRLRPERRWWWSVDLCRRVLLVATYAFLPDWQTKKILMIFMCVIVLAIHSNCQPYVRDRANFTESIYLLVLCTLAIMQIVENKDAKYYVCLVLLGILAVHALVVTVYKAGRFFRKRFDCACTWTKTAARRQGYDELESTQTEQNLDPETEIQRSILDTIFDSSEDGSANGKS